MYSSVLCRQVGQGRVTCVKFCFVPPGGPGSHVYSSVLCLQVGQGHMCIVLFCAARWARITCVYCSSIFCRQVGQGHMCLWCNEKGKSFQTAAAVQKHMTDKGHCRLRHEGETLIGEYLREFIVFYRLCLNATVQCSCSSGRDCGDSCLFLSTVERLD